MISFSFLQWFLNQDDQLGVGGMLQESRVLKTWDTEFVAERCWGKRPVLILSDRAKHEFRGME